MLTALRTLRSSCREISVSEAHLSRHLKSIIIPDTVTWIGDEEASYRCPEYDVFGGNNIDYITIPESVVYISSFSANSIFVPDTVTRITDINFQINPVIPCKENTQYGIANFIRYDRACSVVETGGDDEEGYY